MSAVTCKPNFNTFWLFITVTFVFSWLCWIPTALFGSNPRESLWIIPYILGGFGPSFAGVFLMYRTRSSQEERRDFWRRTINFRQISLKWYLVILLIFPLVFTLSLLTDAWLNGRMTELPMLAKISANPLMLIGFVLSSFIAGALSEELGWRGFALDRLQARWNPLISSLILAFFWWAWHLPLFFISGTSQHQLGFGSLDFWVFTLNILPLTLIMTWAYNKNQRSILSAVLLHMAYNFVLSFVFPFPKIQAVYLYAAVLVVILINEGSSPETVV